MQAILGSVQLGADRGVLLEETERQSGTEEGSKMKLWKNNVLGLSPTSVSIMNGADSRQALHRRPASLATRVREIDCMLADIQAQVQRLHRERIHLGLVREELAGTEPKLTRV